MKENGQRGVNGSRLTGSTISRKLDERVRSKMRKWLGIEEFSYLKKNVINLNSVEELKRVFGWSLEAVLDDPSVYEFEYVEDVNGRRIRDAECLATVVRNVNPSVCLDLGTSTGHSAAQMAVNAHQAQVFTVNSPPEDLHAGQGGVFTTVALERNKIGTYYRERNLTNITQILANTAHWEPNIGTIDVAFVDACHDADFVYNDTRKVLKHMKPGSFILWHDFNPDLVEKYDWIHSVCLGIEKLFQQRMLNGRVFHIRDSWTGVYQVS